MKPIISIISRRFGVDANILLGNIDYIQGAPLGELVVELSGSSASIEEALDFIREARLTYEVLDR